MSNLIPLDSLNSILSHMVPISLEQMTSVKLMNRVDQKYLMDRQQLSSLLERIDDSYYVQRIDDEAIAPYNTLYFDTDGLAMYTAHHNKKLNRQKLRIRCYRNSFTTFFEVKNKNNKGNTKKRRISVSPDLFYHALEDDTIHAYIAEHSPYPVDSLRPQVENAFRRITLVDKGMTERITIDSDITFHNHSSGLDYNLSPLVLMEVKHAVGAPLSIIEKEMLEMRIHPKSISKYCIGTALTNPEAKINRFKAKIRYINEIVTASL